MPYISVNKSNGQILSQDSGRWGTQAWGVSSGGAADKMALKWANVLLGNPEHACALEFFLGNAELQFSHTSRVSLCGADCSASLNGIAVTNWTAFDIKAGDTLVLSLPKSGIYCYLAIKNGFDIQTVLGSRSITLRESIGPNKGRGFDRGSEIDYNEYLPRKQRITLHWQFQPNYNTTPIIRIVPSALANKQNIQWPNLENQNYDIHPNSNKMGVRLNGQTISLKSDHGFSEGVVEGAIQVPPNGQPIVLMADHQTIGGYPLLGCAYAVDIPLLAQRRPGQTVRLKKGSIENALDTLVEQNRRIKTLTP